MRKYSRASKSRSDGVPGESGEGGDRRIFPLSFSVTAAGGLYILLLLPLSLAAIRTGNNLLVIVLAAMLAAVPVSGLVSLASLKRLSLSLEMPENVFAGERVALKVAVKNRKRVLASFSLRVEERGTPGAPPLLRRLRAALPRHRKRDGAAGTPDGLMDRPAYFPVVGPGESRTALVLRSFPRRGRYTLHGFRVSTRFPFGLFERARLARAEGEVFVYPSPRSISPFFHLLPFLPGALESARPGPGENLRSIRRYREGESARIIDWKATAKTLRLMAREYAREEESRFCLILDTRAHAPRTAAGGEAFEKAVSMAAGIASHFIEEGTAIAFLSPAAYLAPGGDARHLDRILRELAVIAQDEAPAAETVGPWEPGAFRDAAPLPELEGIFSDKHYKIILTPRPRGTFPAAVWRSAHVIFFDQL
ncbi:MAG: DUF58 domain-containing protein [Acidobacteria bacterium]|nr:DUF58 domain-containing protein [Acidobacteriota bacterium]